MPRILHFMESFSPLTETFIYDSIISLEKNGIENHIVALLKVNTAERPFQNTTFIPAPQLSIIERTLNKVSLKAGMVDVEGLREKQYRDHLIQTVKKVNPDVIHAHFGPPACLIGAIANELRIPMAASFYGMDVSRLTRDPKWIKRYSQLFSTIEAIVPLSQEMADRLIQIGAPAQKIQTVKLAKKLEQYPYRKPTEPLLNWVSVGRLTEKKGHLDSIKAFAKADVESSATLKIVGVGEMQEDLQKLIEELNLSKRVFLIGSKPADEVSEIMSEADAFILCSKTAADGDMEGTPTVLLEAQAIGLPCVSTRHAGIPEIIPVENHRFLSAEGDIQNLAKSITEISNLPLSDLELISSRGRQLVESEHSVENQTKALSKIYEQIARH